MLLGFSRLYNLHFSKDREFCQRMREILGFAPKNITIFKNAFVHRSLKGNSQEFSGNNERLEYLGDALLSSIVADYLYGKYPKANEGFLTKMRSKMVKRKTLNDIAEKMGLDLILNSENNVKISNSMLGNAFEALVGAVYLERGYNGARAFIVNQVIRNYLDIHALETIEDNYKSTLLEYCQKSGLAVHFKLLSKYKQDKRDRFKMAVVVDGKEIAAADDFNKKSAEQAASRLTLQSLEVGAG